MKKVNQLCYKGEWLAASHNRILRSKIETSNINWSNTFKWIMAEYNTDNGNSEQSNHRTSYKIKNFLKLLCTGDIINKRSRLH